MKKRMKQIGKLLIAAILTAVGIISIVSIALYRARMKVISLQDVSLKQINEWDNYAIDISETYEMVFRTSYKDVSGKNCNDELYLVPYPNEENTYLAVMSNGEVSPVDSNQRYVGNMNKIDWLLNRKIQQEIKGQDINLSGKKIFPYYLDLTDNYMTPEFYQTIWILILSVLISILLIRDRKNKKPEKPKKIERVLYRDVQGKVQWRTIINETISKTNKILRIPRNIIFGQKKRQAYNALRSFYRNEIIAVVIWVVIGIPLVQGNAGMEIWGGDYYFFFHRVESFMAFLLYSLAALLIFSAVCKWIINPLGRKVRKSMAESDVGENECLELLRQKGKLYKSGRGGLFISDDYILVGSKKRVDMIRQYQIERIDLCYSEKSEKEGNFNPEWIRIYVKSGEFYDAYMKRDIAIEAVKELKKAKGVDYEY